MAIAAAFDLEIHQFDAVNAFINSSLNEEIYCYAPEGFEQGENHWLLLRALYGLKQSPSLRYNDFSAALEELGLQPVSGVNCLYSNNHLLLFFYVDYIAIIYKKRDSAYFNQFVRKLQQKFQFRDLNELKWFLGIRVDRDRPARKLWLCQDTYIRKIANKHHLLDNTKPPNTPLPSERMLAAGEDYAARAQLIFAYQQRVGLLTFASVVTRPDISHPVSKLSTFLKNPTQQHVDAANRAISYLYSTRAYAIEYSGTAHPRCFTAQATQPLPTTSKRAEAQIDICYNCTVGQLIGDLASKRQ